MKNKVYQLALFGDPVSHSLSPQIHQMFARQCGLEVDYRLIKVAASQFAQCVEAFFAQGGHGANVTLPHKHLALSCIENIKVKARQANAVNTLYQSDSQAILGDNTDGIGLEMDLRKRCKFYCQDKKILILGAGGAAQGVAAEIINHKPQKILITNRNVEKAQKIAVHDNSDAVSLSELAQVNEKFDLIIHASSLGHQGKTLQFFQQHVHDKTLCYDLSYGPAAQAFIDHSLSVGIPQSQCVDGLGMLVEQAAAAFELWFHQKPDTSAVIDTLLNQ